MTSSARDALGERPAPRLTCRDVVELLSDHLEGALSAAQRARVEAHLAACPDCLAYLAQLRTTIGALGRLREHDVPRCVLGRLMAAFRGRRGG